MKIKSVTIIPGIGLNVLAVKQRRLIDPDTGEDVFIDLGVEPSSICIKDFAVDPRNPTNEDIQRGRVIIGNNLKTLLSDNDADLVAQLSVLTMQRDAERDARQKAEQERDAERAAKKSR